MTGTATMRAGQLDRPTLSKDGRIMTVHIPITLRHQGGRKQVVTPAGATPWIPTSSRVDNTIVKAVVRANRWRDMLESGRYSTIRDLAKDEAINESYLGRILRLTLLSPTIIEAILEGRQPATLELDDLLQQFPIEWDQQLGRLTKAAKRQDRFPPKADLRRQSFNVRFVRNGHCMGFGALVSPSCAFAV